MEKSDLAHTLNVNAANQQLEAELRPVPALLAADQRERLRKLPFETMHNFRELGGYQNRSGLRLKWGMIYRADKISGLNEQDKHYLERLKLARIVDFRADEERLEAPHSLIDGSSTHIEIMPITVEAAEVDNMIASLQCESTTVDDISNYLINANREMVERFTPVYRQWMQDLLDERNYPQVFHCTAGKDRTGLAAALLMTALDVDRDTIMADYLATNHFTSARIDTVARAIHSSSMFQVNEDVIRVLFSVRPQFIQAAFDAMEDGYGGIDQYMEVGLGIGAVERQCLRAMLLEPAA